MFQTVSELEIAVVRHGETRWNAEGRYQGHSDNELNASGELQARALAERFASDAASFHGILASDLRRAMDTAKIIAERTGLAITTDERIRERKVGIFRGLTPQEAAARHSQEFTAFKSDVAYQVPEGESKLELHHRVRSFLDDISVQFAGKRFIVVTHGGVIECIIRHVFSIPLSLHLLFSNFNAGLNRFVHRNDHWIVATLGDISHLHEFEKRHPIREEKLLD